MKRKGTPAGDSLKTGKSKTSCLESNELSISTKRWMKKLNLKPDHQVRPVWVLPTGLILLEASSKLYRIAYDFLVAVSEPRSRPVFIHQYKLTTYSLLAAVSLNLSADIILQALQKLSKNILPRRVIDFIRNSTVNFGKAKVVLKRNRIYIEAGDPTTLDKLLQQEVIANARVEALNEESAKSSQKKAYDVVNLDNEGLELEPDSDITFLLQPENVEQDQKQDDQNENAEANDKDEGKHVYSIEIKQTELENVKRAALTLEYPLLEEYDFRRDTHGAPLDIELKQDITIRNYQSKSLSKMFGNGRARSGVIVLPCGAGKTLTGITAACTIGKSCIILCTSGVAVRQWKEQLQQFTTVKPFHIVSFTAKQKDEIPDTGCILITTYNMMSFNDDKRSESSEYIVNQIKKKDWGLLICDEVHVVPAKLFRKVCTKITAHCKLGLSATLVREDNLINDLNFLIGPKLYEANWMDLTKEGFLANVSCNEVVCPMTKEFFKEYLNLRNPNVQSVGSSSHIRHLLCVLNPNKIIACEYLVNYHEAKGDRILIFCDNIFALHELEKRIRRKVIHGKTSEQDRLKILNSFKNNLSRTSGTIIISKVGDIAINLPSANVLIQISSHFGSRRQEAQRLGRILRPKSEVLHKIEDVEDELNFNAFFYSLVSADTEEIYYSGKRRQYLLENGYSFKTLTSLGNILSTQSEEASIFYGSTFNNLRDQDEQMNLLARILIRGKQSYTIKQKQKSFPTPYDIESDSDVVSQDDFENVGEDENEEEVESERSFQDFHGDTISAPKPKRQRLIISDSESDSDNDGIQQSNQTSVNINALTGASGLEYMEYDGSAAE